MVFAVVNFLMLFPRLKNKSASTKRARQKIQALCDAAIVVPFEQSEDLRRREFGLFLLRMCIMVWSLFVVSYFTEALGSYYSVEFDPNFHFLADCVVDLTAKVLYISVITDAYAKLFDVSRAVSEAKDASILAQRHEIEKLDVATTTAREVDKKASRFSRHEVKNGILTSIGLLESLTDAQARKEDEVANSCLVELNNTLVEMLNTVVSEVNMNVYFMQLLVKLN
jgi:hypothetical protein